MAQLAALHFDKGDWDVYVTEGIVHGVLEREYVMEDVLGRKLPNWKTAEWISGVKPSEQVRLANELKGMSKLRRQKIYKEWKAQASMVASQERGS